MELDMQAAFSLHAFPGHASYFFVVLAMLMTNIMALRLLALASGAAGFVYSFMVLGDPVGSFWEIAFMVANLIQLAIIAWRSRTVHFSDEEHSFHQQVIPLVPAGLARRLIDIGTWRDLDAGATLTRQGEAVDVLTYVSRGTVDIAVDGETVATCSNGDFVGELGIFSDHPATATAITATPVRVLMFEGHCLLRVQRREPQFRLALDAAFNANLRRKLTAANMSRSRRGAPA